jgi:putative nucleotidyltransferase with HDIG domain
MKLHMTFLQSRLARRILMLFVSCALLPILALSWQSFSHVTSELREQSHRRLQQHAKGLGMASYERLTLLDTEVEGVASRSNGETLAGIRTTDDIFTGGLRDRFNAMFILSEGSVQTSIFGRASHPPGVTPEERQRLRDGKTVLLTQNNQDSTLSLFMVRPINVKDSEASLLFAEINSDYLWGIGPENSLPPMCELFVLDQSGSVIISSLPEDVSRTAQVGYKGNSSASRQFEWRSVDKEYLASYWTVFLKPRFNAPNWTVVLSQASDDVLAPLNYFKRVFPLVTLLCLTVVLLLCMIYIRRTFAPLEILKEGTRQIAQGNFSSLVNVTSGDEFDELAACFNSMSTRLGRQFKALTTIADIDRAILSSLESQKVVDSVLTGMHDFFACDLVLVCLMDTDQPNTARTYVHANGIHMPAFDDVIEIGHEDMQRLIDNTEYLLMDRDGKPLKYLAAPLDTGIRSFIVLPVFLRDRLLAVIHMGYALAYEVSHDDIKQARQLADQMALGLYNSRLLEDLERLNWGALQALARTVDAKSPWTAGHSERVTNHALHIAQLLGLPPEEIDVLHRAALLHDIGKIGMPHSILDKPGPLTDAEYDLVKEHPGIGARILEPISAYKNILPIVLQHHERFDGKGYPQGLAGDSITLTARILSVADVFDALISERPYRLGWTIQRVIQHMREQAGLQFDPELVDVFLRTLEKKEKSNFIGVRAFPYCAE